MDWFERLTGFRERSATRYELRNFAIRRQRLTFATRTAPSLAATHQAFDLLETSTSEALTLSMARISCAAFGGRRPLTGSKPRKKEASMRSAALPAELAPPRTRSFPVRSLVKRVVPTAARPSAPQRQIAHRQGDEEAERREAGAGQEGEVKPADEGRLRHEAPRRVELRGVALAAQHAKR